MNIRLLIEYDGFAYCGWQRQPHCPSIQAAIEDIIASTTGKPTFVQGAGRTDAGVHAYGQVANFHTDFPIAPTQWRPLLNASLPPDIRILDAQLAPDEFHAQKDSIGKVYEYRILNRKYGSALDRRALFFPQDLDWDKIRKSLPHFVGTKDFRAFRAAKTTVKTTTRTITDFRLIEEGSGFFTFRIEGTGFLKQMVRTIVGTLVEIGQGKRKADDLPAVFASRDRQRAGRTLAGLGLSLVLVRYRDE